MKRIKSAVVSIQLLVMLNAFGGGYYGMAGAPGVHPAWLEGSPFSSYFVPSLFLFAVVGGGMETAGAAWLRRNRLAPWLSLGMGVILIAWIVAQLAIIGYVSPLQPISFAAGTAIAALALTFLRREHTRAARLSGAA